MINRILSFKSSKKKQSQKVYSHVVSGKDPKAMIQLLVLAAKQANQDQRELVGSVRK